MSQPYGTGLTIIAILALGACVSHGPGGVAYDTDRTPREATGATMTGGGGSVSGGSPESKDQRGNTPPGLDRDGHGPAAGAIVDPTGAATRGKPY